MARKTCEKHGDSNIKHIGQGIHKRIRCLTCCVEAVTKRRRKVKERLVEQHGGKCVLCGYNKYFGALAFHHIDPSTKSFSIAGDGITHSFKKLEIEAKKCVLVCHNCHSEVHSGLHNLAALLSNL